MPVFNSPLSPHTAIYSSIHSIHGFLGNAPTPRLTLRTPEEVHDFIFRFVGPIEMWEMDDGFTDSRERALRFFVTPFMSSALGPMAHILRDINATGFKVYLCLAGLLPLKRISDALIQIARHPKSRRVFVRREIDAMIARVRASRHPPHAVRAYTRAMVAFAEIGVSDDHALREADRLYMALLDGMENARRGRRLPHPDEQARVLRFALAGTPAYLRVFVQVCADEYARG